VQGGWKHDWSHVVNICCRYNPRQGKVSALSFVYLALSVPRLSILFWTDILYNSGISKKGQRYKRTALPLSIIDIDTSHSHYSTNKVLSNKHKIHHAFRSCKVQALRYIDLELPILVSFVRQGPMRLTPSLSKYDLPFLETIHNLTPVQSRSSYRSNGGGGGGGFLNFSLA
jgi:hypothetical protein